MRRSRRESIIILLSTLASVLSCLLMVLSPNQAWATEDKSYPATSCRRMQGNTGGLGTRNNGTIENDSTATTLTVICPIVRDNTQSTAGWSIDVRVHDQTSSGLVSCTVTSAGTWGSIVHQVTQTTNTLGTGLGTLTMSPTSQGLEGYSVLKCSIPPVAGGLRSKLLAYVVKEPSGADVSSDQKSYTGTYAELATAGAGAFPFINYPDLGKAAPIAAAANDVWTLPLVRDEVLNFWDRARLRFNDGDADLNVSCWLANYNENGTVAGLLSFGPQSGAPGQATTTVNINAMAGANNGPYAMYCQGIAADVSATMYDLRELSP